MTHTHRLFYSMQLPFAKTCFRSQASPTFPLFYSGPCLSLMPRILRSFFPLVPPIRPTITESIRWRATIWTSQARRLSSEVLVPLAHGGVRGRSYSRLLSGSTMKALLSSRYLPALASIPLAGKFGGSCLTQGDIGLRPLSSVRIKSALQHLSTKPDLCIGGFFLADLCIYASFFKLNELHLHASDNLWNPAFLYNGGDSWRDLYAAFRFRPSLLSNIVGLVPRRNESWSREDFRDMQSTCLMHGVNIVPEIDTPGHSLVITQWKSELMLVGNPDQVGDSRYFFSVYVLDC